MTRYLARTALIAAMLAAFSASAEELRLTTLYRTGTFTRGGGKANVVMRDVVGDARPEVISCNYGGSAFALSYDGTAYRDRWISPNVGCTAVGVGDRNGDGFNKVFVAGSPTGVSNYGVTGPGYLFAFDATSYGPELAKVQVSATEPVNSIAVGNVDADAGLEVVAITSTKFYVFNAATFALKWSGAYGGHTVAIADLENDGKNEIIIAGTDGHVLNGYTQTYKWGYFGGFGPSMTVGDVDNDGKAEIIGGTGIYNGAPTVKIVNGDTMTTTTISASAEAVGVGDANNDGKNELIVGGDQWSDVQGFDVATGTKLWSVHNPNWGTVGIVVGDPDGDGQNEVVWSSYDPGIFVGNANTQTVESTPDDFNGPFRIAVADLNGDGRLEMVVTATTANSHYYIGVGTAYVLDYETHRLIAKLPIPNYVSIAQLAIGQVDGDAAKEIVLLVSDSSGGQVMVFDGVTFALEWSSGPPPCCSNPSQPSGSTLIVRNIDGDATDEIIYATNEHKIQVLNGAGPFIQYTTAALDSAIYNMDIADVDGDGVLDLAVATQTGAYIFKTSDWTQRTYIPLTSLNGRTIAAAPGHFAVSLSGDGIAMYSGTTLAQEWSCSSGNLTSDLAFANLGAQWRLTAAMSDGSLRIFPTAGSSCPAFDTVSQNVAYNAYASSVDQVQLTFADLNGDGRPELLTGSSLEASLSVLGFPSEPRGDVDSDGVVTDADIDRLAAYLYGNSTATQPAADVNGDNAIRSDDLFYLINYRRGSGPAPSMSKPIPSGDSR